MPMLISNITGVCQTFVQIYTPGWIVCSDKGAETKNLATYLQGKATNYIQRKLTLKWHYDVINIIIYY